MYILIITAEIIFLILFLRVGKFKRKIVHLFRNEKIFRNMELLYFGKEAIWQQDDFIEKKIRLVLLILLLGSITAFAITTINKANPVINESNEIVRGDYDSADKQVTLYVNSDSINKDEKINITVSKRKYNEVVINEKAKEAVDILTKEFLGDNNSPDHVDTRLNLMNSINNYPFSISWKSERPLILKKNGEIDYERLKKVLQENDIEGLLVNLYANISYEDFSEEVELSVNLYLPKQSQEESFIEKLTQTIEYDDKNTREGETMVLPVVIDGETVDYTEKDSITPLIILLLSVFAAVSLFLGKDNDLDKAVKIRNDQMEEDYPKIVNQYALYYCAGMHTKMVWKEICNDYRRSLGRGGEKRYAYEEMIMSEALMSEGIGEIVAYESFASKCKIRKYRRFVSLIEQAVSKGKEQMSEALRKEAEEATNERLSRAKIKGEEAGTKLLIPMFMMLFVVLFIVTLPAFMSFSL